MEQQETWEKALTRRIGQHIRLLRGENSAQWVADRTTELGHPVSRARIADMEGTNRGGSIKLAELIVLAAALQVPPAYLAHPGLADTTTEALPGIETTAWYAYRWFTGDDQLLSNAPHHKHDGPSPIGGHNHAQHLLELLHQHDSLATRYLDAGRQADRAWNTSYERALDNMPTPHSNQDKKHAILIATDDPTVLRHTHTEDDLEKQLENIRKQITDLGATTPYVQHPAIGATPFDPDHPDNQGDAQ